MLPPVRSGGSYVVLGLLGRGGMGTVHLGRMTTAGGVSRLVAIKELHPHRAEDRRALSMFLDEARLSAQIRHANVVATLDVVPVGGSVCLIQDYIDGASLATLLERGHEERRSVPVAVAIAIAIGVLRGLGAAHDARSDDGERLDIVHRDVSPHNVLVGVDGVARVTDFGVARATGNLVATESGVLIGKLAYMAPEQLNGRRATRQSDVFAAGIVLWEMLVGAPLVERGHETATIIATILRGDFAPPSAHRREVSPELDAVVLRALSADLATRYETAADMAAALEALGPASAESVGAFVRDVASAILEERQAMVRASKTPDAFRSLDEVLAELRASSHVGPELMRGSASPPGGSRRRRGILVGTIAFAAVTLAGAVWLHRHDASVPDNASSAETALFPPASAIPPLADSIVAAPVELPSSRRGARPARGSRPPPPPRPPPSAPAKQETLPDDPRARP